MSAGRFASLGVSLLALVACQPRQVSFSLAFDEATTRDETAVVVVRIRSGDCTGTAFYNSAFALTDPLSARTPPLLQRGTYGFEAEARAADCTILARTCVTRELPLEDGTLRLSLADVAPSAACAPGQCMGGECAGDEPDAGPMPVDAGPRDGGPRDGGEPMGCTGSGDCPGGECRNMSCCYGCWDGTSCQGGTAASACGTAGAMCEACGADQTCIGGGCVEAPAVTLSLSPATTYVRGGGRLWSGGTNAGMQRGQLDSATANVLARQTTSLAFLDVAAAQLATCGVDAGGGLYCWGSNAPGLLGVGSTDFGRREATPQSAGGGYREVDAGNEHFCAIRTDGRLFCWGANVEGRLGVPVGARTSPTEVTGGGTWSAVSAGSLHTCAIRTDGALYCWGSAAQGKLGVAGATDGHTPGRVGTDADWSVVSAGVDHTCGIRGGDLYCWGNREFGRLGDGMTTGTVDTPVLVDDTRVWRGVAAGQFHTCGVTTGSELYCWGVSPRGQTGLGSPGESTTPAMVGTGFDVVEVGWTHSCAAQESDGALDSLRCWGEGRDGLLGNGATDDATTPVTPTLEPAP